MSNSDIARALQQLRPGAEWVLRGVNYSDLLWTDLVQTKPTSAEVDAAIAGFASTDGAEQARQTSIKADTDRVAMLARLKTASPAQIDTWVQNNVTTLAQAQKAIGIILKVIALDGRQ